MRALVTGAASGSDGPPACGWRGTRRHGDGGADRGRGCGRLRPALDAICARGSSGSAREAAAAARRHGAARTTPPVWSARRCAPGGARRSREQRRHQPSGAALLDFTVEDWDRLFAVNTRATWLLAKAAHPPAGGVERRDRGRRRRCRAASARQPRRLRAEQGGGDHARPKVLAQEFGRRGHPREHGVAGHDPHRHDRRRSTPTRRSRRSATRWSPWVAWPRPRHGGCDRVPAGPRCGLRERARPRRGRRRHGEFPGSYARPLAHHEKLALSAG